MDCSSFRCLSTALSVCIRFFSPAKSNWLIHDHKWEFFRVWKWSVNGYQHPSPTTHSDGFLLLHFHLQWQLFANPYSSQTLRKTCSLGVPNQSPSIALRLSPMRNVGALAPVPGRNTRSALPMQTSPPRRTHSCIHNPR